MTHEVVHIDHRLWSEFKNTATKQRRRPQTILINLIRNYLEEQADERLFAEMRHDLRKVRMSDEQIVQFVRQYRREKRARRANGKKS